MVHTCPRCELRFAMQAELEEHLTVDHHVDPENFERFHYRPLAKRPQTKRYLVVANRTLIEESVVDKIVSKTRDGHVHLVVPATPDADGAHHDDKGLALATFRMRQAIDKLHAAGIEAEGEVGDRDPLHAASRALEHEMADEIIISTLPKGMSQWLDVDVPAALQRRFGLPVEVITSHAD